MIYAILWRMKNRTIFVLLLAFLLAACNGKTPPAEPSATIETETPPASAVPPTETLAPVPTDTQAPPPLAVLLAPPGGDAALADELEALLRPALEGAGLRLERWQSVGNLPGDLPGELRLLVALPPDPGLVALAAAAPQAQFLAVGIPGLAAGANLSVVGTDGGSADQQAFMAGVIAAMITPDWRVGVLSVSDTPAGTAARQSFLNGAIYFCGLCLPYYGPIVDYPTYAEAPAGAGSAEWQAAVQVLVDNAVQTVYVAPEVSDPGAWEALRQADVVLLGEKLPSQDLQERWAVSLQTDPSAAVLELVPQLLAGQGGQTISLPLNITGVNEALFSPGKQQRAEEILADLLAGYILTK